MDRQDAVFELPIRIAYIRPRWLVSFIVFAGVGAVICLLYVDHVWSVRASLIAGVLVLTAHEIHQTGQRDASLILDGMDHWLILFQDAEAVPAILSKATVVLSELIVLVLQTAEGKRYRFILTPDNIDKTQLRRLRVRLFYPVSHAA
jgi:hypothetical protein